mgnify:CR=1 FL=1
MSEFTPELTDDHIAFVTKQPVFFVATAADGARINLSPKGMDTFRVLGPNRVAWSPISMSADRAMKHRPISRQTGGSRSCSARLTGHR